MYDHDRGREIALKKSIARGLLEMQAEIGQNRADTPEPPTAPNTKVRLAGDPR
jgi:hypothetical protein